MGPHSGLSLRGGTDYPAPHWNLELGRGSNGSIIFGIVAKFLFSFSPSHDNSQTAALNLMKTCVNNVP